MKIHRGLLVFQLIITFSGFGEIISVPDFNYSINPLEGWSLQSFNDSNDLSWLSKDGNIALSVSSWSGEEFSNLRDMFNQLTHGLQAYGDCVPFTYLTFNGALGEVTFEMDNLSYKGWFLFLDGSDFDYYISTFSRFENYDEYNSEMQSVIDSFSPGNLGELNPGPFSSFLNESPSRVQDRYNIDFFGHNLTVVAAKYDFGSSQAIIEREANIMLNYSGDPANFYNAWKRYYKIIFRDNYNRLDPLFKELYPYLSHDTNYDIAEKLMFWIQGFEYERTQESYSDLLNPLEASIYKLGDCDSRSILLGILLHKFSVNSILLTSEKVKHALLAVDIPGDGAAYEFNGKKYLTIELTAKTLIGEIDASHADPSLWTPVEMGYSNEL